MFRFLATAIVGGVACATPQVPPSQVPASPRTGNATTTAPTVEPVSDVGWEGEYDVVGGKSLETCDAGIYLATNHLRIGGEPVRLWANVVDREYAVTEKGATLEASGAFDGGNGCPNPNLREQWELRRGSNGTLAGTLTSIWLMPPDCATECTVRFNVRATPTDAGLGD